MPAHDVTGSSPKGWFMVTKIWRCTSDYGIGYSIVCASTQSLRQMYSVDSTLVPFLALPMSILFSYSIVWISRVEANLWGLVLWVLHHRPAGSASICGWSKTELTLLWSPHSPTTCWADCEHQQRKVFSEWPCSEDKMKQKAKNSDWWESSSISHRLCTILDWRIGNNPLKPQTHIRPLKRSRPIGTRYLNTCGPTVYKAAHTTSAILSDGDLPTSSCLGADHAESII